MAALRTHAGLGALALPQVVTRAALQGRFCSTWNPATRLYDYYVTEPVKVLEVSHPLGLGVPVDASLPELPTRARKVGSGERPLGHIVRQRGRAGGRGRAGASMMGGLGWLLAFLLPIVPP